MDPASSSNLIDQRRINDFRIEGNRVMFTLLTSGWDEKLKTQLHFACIEAINEIYPEAEVHIHMKQDTEEGGKRNILPQVKHIIAIASGKGGVGKSTVAVNTALALKEAGYKVGLLDADLHGPSVPTMFDLHGVRPKVREVYGKHKIIPLEAMGLEVMSIGFIVEPEQAVILRGPRLAGILKQFIQDCLWSDLDYLIIDLPPGTGDIQLTLVQTVPVTGVVMVTTPQKLSFADALKAMNMFRLENINVPILGIVENMAWFTPAELPDNKYYIFGKGSGEKLAREAGVPVLGQIPLVQSIQEKTDTGKPTMAEEGAEASEYFRALAESLVKEVERRVKELDPTQRVQVNR
jgi:ATP-binding protein involved in chromosome partitioning